MAKTTSSSTATTTTTTPVVTGDEIYAVHDATSGQPIPNFCLVEPSTGIGSSIPILFEDGQPASRLFRDRNVVTAEKFEERFHSCTCGIFDSFEHKDWANLVVRKSRLS